MSNINDLSKTITEIVRESQQRGTEPYDTSAEVIRIEDGIAWVHIPGGVDETPVQMTVDALPGDLVQVRVAGGRAWLTGNASRPPTDDTVAKDANNRATKLQAQIQEVNNHFWWDSFGAHVSTIAGDASYGNNVLLDSDSLDIRKGETTIASFGSTTQIGKSDDTHLEMTFNELCLKDKEGTEYFLVKDMRDEQGVATVTESETTSGRRTLYSLHLAPATDTNYSVSLDGVEVTSGITKTTTSFTFATAPAADQILRVTYGTTSPQAKYLTFGYRPDSVYGSHPAPLSSVLGAGIASDIGAVASGFFTQATSHSAHAEGNGTVSRGMASHAEGRETNASGGGSHAEGINTYASGGASHAEGQQNTASGTASHVEGSWSIASGEASHAQNEGTRANGNAQTALGKYNIPDTTSAVIIGNGNGDTSRKNAFTLDWNGMAKLIGQSPEVRLVSDAPNAASYMRAEPANQYGNNLLIQAGGNLIAGGGEYASSRYNASLVLDTNEDTYIGSDGDVYIESNGQTIANAKIFKANRNGDFEFPNAKIDDSGKFISNSRFAKLGNTEISVGVNTTNLAFWGDTANKVLTRATNNTDNVQYGFSARADRTRLWDYTNNSLVWDIFPTEVKATGENMGQGTVSVPSAAWTEVGETTLTAGVYLVFCSVSFNSNATGIRRLGLHTVSGTEGGGWGWNDTNQAVNGTPTVCQVQGVINIAGPVTYYLNAYQNSGGALNCNPRWHCVKIG